VGCPLSPQASLSSPSHRSTATDCETSKLPNTQYKGPKPETPLFTTERMKKE